MSAFGVPDMVAHLLLAIGIQLFVVRIARSWWGGALAGIAWVLSREIAQADYRWIEAFGGGLRANMPWWGGLDPHVWTHADPWIDWIMPTLAVSIVALIATRQSRRR